MMRWLLIGHPLNQGSKCFGLDYSGFEEPSNSKQWNQMARTRRYSNEDGSWIELIGPTREGRNSRYNDFDNKNKNQVKH
ncbi:hypothetical protein HanRHA438_Chr05g0210871 [Helianthus annuus]|nr:hypothetical protein HanRHA438_Chr05g0210871 [Helianthus annuus]